MMAPGIDVAAQVLAERLVNSAAAFSILAALAWLVLRVVRGQDAGTRFALWFSALLTFVALPFVSSSLAHLPFAENASNLRGRVVLSASWASYLVSVWIAGAILFLVRLAVGLWRVRSVRHNCIKVNLATLDPAVAAVFHEFGSRRRVSLCTSTELAVPAAIGLFRPAIVFPEWLLPQLSSGEVEMIARHELAHLARWDDWTNLIQKLVKAVFFFHPAVWWIENRLTLEREMACDDIVLAQTESPKEYASSLISFAEKLHCGRPLALAQALVSRVHQISLRVAQILDPRRPKATRRWKPGLGLSACLLALIFGAASSMPQFVAFRAPVHDTVPTMVASAATSTGAVDHTVALQQNRAHMIAASFHARRAAHRPLHLTKVPRTPLIFRASADNQQPVVQETIFILRAPRYDATAPTVPEDWTLCIWTWSGTNADGRPVQSAILVRWI